MPVRLEVGPRDVKGAVCVLSRRDKPGKEGKEFNVEIAPEALVPKVQASLDAVQVRVRSQVQSWPTHDQ